MIELQEKEQERLARLLYFPESIMDDDNQQELKISYYTQVFYYSDGMRLAYNSLTGRILNLEGEEGDKILDVLTERTQRKKYNKDDILVKRLIQDGHLIDSEINELSIIKEMFNKYRLIDKKVVSLTILPTLGCNFGCNYCFEKHSRGLMSSKVQESLLKFVYTNLSKGSTLSVTWFGGEPLIGMTVIENLSIKLRDLCDNLGAAFSNSKIITNGYLLTRSITNRLIKLGIKRAQITIDGTPDIHDRRRFLLNGNGTFYQILENIKELPDDFRVQIRINVDKDNKDIIFDLMKLLQRENLMARVTPYLAKVESFGGCGSCQGNLLSSEKFISFKNVLAKKCQDAGIVWNDSNSSTPSVKTCGFCMVDNLHSFVVEPDGKLLKCWAEAGNPTGTEIAHLLRPASWNNIGFSSLQSRDPFEDDECRSCKILPSCMGGCPKVSENNKHQKRKECPPIRYSLGNDIRSIYERNNLERPLV
jgi:uncharacterized protein